MNTTPWDMETVFGRRGLLAQRHGSFEFRPSQLEMAEAIQEALKGKDPLVVEAGTGTGKTLAYLVPVLASQKKAIVSTGTKNLQEQLFFRDIPFLKRHLFPGLKAAYMKGRNNYLCLKRWKQFEKDPSLRLFERGGPLSAIRTWSRSTPTGDRAELADLPEGWPLWDEISAETEDCPGQGCEEGSHCFLTKMRQRAEAADLVVVNHHLFFADLLLRDLHNEVLPPYEALVFDEAHQIEDVATQFFGYSMSLSRIQQLAREVRRLLHGIGREDHRVERTLERLLRESEALFRAFPVEKPRTRIVPDRLSTIRSIRVGPLASLELLQAQVWGLEGESEAVLPVVQRISKVQWDFLFIVSADHSDFVYWYEPKGKEVVLHASPILVATELQRRLYRLEKPLIFLSATLSTNGHFRYFKERLGLDDRTITLLLPSPFDFQKQTLLYLPEHLPDPNRPEFLASAAREIERILLASSGRAFVLFTSIRNMQEVYGMLKSRLPYRTFLQGDGAKSALLDAFREDIHSVLFATSSFWEGVDVPGEALSCVIVDRLPFEVPSDPVVEARADRIGQEGGNPFYDYQVPMAILALKQGLGRLIRSRKDRGLLCILDSRVRTKGYGQMFLRSLPGCPTTHDILTVELFFRNMEGDGSRGGRSG